MGFDPRRRGRGWGAPRGRGSQEGGAQGVGTGATQARGAGGGRLVFATAKSLWVYYKAELGGRGAGQNRQSLAQRKGSGCRKLTPAEGTCNPRSGQQRAGQASGTAKRSAISKAVPQLRATRNSRPAQPAELPPPVWAA